jgi:hypothetical protein
MQAIAPDPGTVVLFGAKFFGRQCVEGDVAGPVVKGIRCALAKERVVVLVDEFNTTKCHLQCGGVRVVGYSVHILKTLGKNGAMCVDVQWIVSVWPHFLAHGLLSVVLLFCYFEYTFRSSCKSGLWR